MSGNTCRTRPTLTGFFNGCMLPVGNTRRNIISNSAAPTSSLRATATGGHTLACPLLCSSVCGPRSATMRPLLLLLASLTPPLDVSGFLVGGAVASRTAAAARRAATATRPAAGPPMPAMSADGVPAVVVSFGLTPRERLAAEEAVLGGGQQRTFPTGVRFVDGSAAAADGDGSTTIRQVREAGRVAC